MAKTFTWLMNAGDSPDQTLSAGHRISVSPASQKRQEALEVTILGDQRDAAFAAR